VVVVVLDAFIIDRILRRERERGRERPALQIPVPPPPPRDEKPDPEKGREQGVVIIDFEIKSPG
jgi:hypothetical protein